MMRPLLLSAAALLSLAGCNSEPETLTNERPDPQAEAMANAAPVTLPPAMSASVAFRCKDNSLVYVDFFDGSFVNYRTDRAAPPTVLRAPVKGEPYVAEGYSLTGDAKSISLTAPGKGSQSCNA